MIIKLSKRQRLHIIQVYAPTSSHPVDEVDAMYEEINDILNQDITMPKLDQKLTIKNKPRETLE